MRLLIIEHVRNDADLCLAELKRSGLAVIAEVVETREDFIERVKAKPFDAILADYRLPTWVGMDTIPMLREFGLDIPVILVTGALGEEQAVECLKLGAADFVLKDRLARLSVAIRRALAERVLRQEAERSKQNLSEVVEMLKAQVRELQEISQEANLLREMGDLLQTCLTVDEAYQVIRQATKKLFPIESGALCVLNASRNLVEPVAIWGDFPSGEGVFAPEDCWALRRGRVQSVENTGSGLLCKHLGPSPKLGSLCVPMVAQGESLGLLHLRWGASVPVGAEERGAEARQRQAVAVAERIAMALANLKLRESLRSQSIRDPLTELFNRRYMEESLEREMRRAIRNKRPLGAIMLDLDHFKRFNDKFSHEAGDTLLTALGQLLQKRTRKEDIACRYGGEEFVLILPEAALEPTRLRAEQLREEIKHLQVHHRGQALGTLTLSLGVSSYPEHGETASDILRIADAALYCAKAEGRDRVVVGQPAVIETEAPLALDRENH